MAGLLTNLPRLLVITLALSSLVMIADFGGRQPARALPAGFVMEPPWTPGESHTVLTGSSAHTCPSGNVIQDCRALDFTMGDQIVRAAAPGRVQWADWKDASSSFHCFGNSVSIQHANGMVTFYAHLDSITFGIVTGKEVRTGDALGVAGDTGTGRTGGGRFCGTWNPHLHFGAYLGASAPENSPPFGGTPQSIEFTNCSKSSGAPCTSLSNGERLTKGGAGYAGAFPLGQPNLGAWCQQLGHRGVIVLERHAYGLACVTQANGFVGIDVLVACKTQFGDNSAVDLMRNYYDPFNWECYRTGVLLGSPDLGGYCRSLGYAGVVETTRNAYGLKCGGGGVLASISVYQACQWTFRRTDLIDSLRDFNNPQNWKCWTIR